MKKVIIGVCCFMLLISSVCLAKVYVSGYFRKDGTYVSPHYRSDPDGIVTNNYSYPGNYNPNTGEITGGTPNYIPSAYTPPTYTNINISQPSMAQPPIPNTLEAIIPDYNVKINGKDISTYANGWTPLIYEDITYIPMTSYLANALNLSISFDNTNGFNLSKKEGLKSEKEKFMDDYVVIVSDNGTNKYHKHGCSELNLSSFWVYNIDAAKANGYTACEKCN